MARAHQHRRKHVTRHSIAAIAYQWQQAAYLASQCISDNDNGIRQTTIAAQTW